MDGSKKHTLQSRKGYGSIIGKIFVGLLLGILISSPLWIFENIDMSIRRGAIIAGVVVGPILYIIYTSEI
jgi:hypothetical protein